MWFSRLGALQDKFEGTNPDGFRAGVLKIAEDPETVERLRSSGPWDSFMAVADQGRNGDDGRLMMLVNCWFIGNAETLEMWRDYGDRGKGIAIRSTVNRLATAFQIPGDCRLISRVGRISYVDFRSHELRTNDVNKVAFIKDKSFERENEVRVLTLNSFHSGCLNSDGTQIWGRSFDPNIKGLCITCDLKVLIRSVIVGPNSTQHFRMLIKRIVARYGLTIDVEYSKVAPFS